MWYKVSMFLVNDNVSPTLLGAVIIALSTPLPLLPLLPSTQFAWTGQFGRIRSDFSGSKPFLGMNLFYQYMFSQPPAETSFICCVRHKTEKGHGFIFLLDLSFVSLLICRSRKGRHIMYYLHK